MIDGTIVLECVISVGKGPLADTDLTRVRYPCLLFAINQTPGYNMIKWIVSILPDMKSLWMKLVHITRHFVHDVRIDPAYMCLTISWLAFRIFLSTLLIPYERARERVIVIGVYLCVEGISIVMRPITIQP